MYTYSTFYVPWFFVALIFLVFSVLPSMDRVLIIPPVDFSHWDMVTASASIQERPSIYFVPLGSPPNLILILLAHPTDFFFLFFFFFPSYFTSICNSLGYTAPITHPIRGLSWIGGLDEAPATAPGVGNLLHFGSTIALLRCDLNKRKKLTCLME